MSGSTRSFILPLPNLWPRHARSAIDHATGMAQTALTATRSRAANGWNERIRLRTKNDRFRQEVALLREEMRIKDSRMERIPPQRRPHYPPVERLAILELRAARHWSHARTAARMLITPATIASWTGRLDEEGPAALVQMPEPVNRFPEFVGYLVKRLKVLCPTMGQVRMPGALPQRWPFCWWVSVALDR